MTAIMKVHGLADGTMFDREMWVESYDVDVEPLWKASLWRKGGGCIVNGMFGGRIVLTPRREEALRFDTRADAMVAWNRISVTRPRRPDGRPNKPMTALTVEVEPDV
jgi:hypothetical protein